MRLLADEGVEAGIVARLRAEGHDLVYIAERAPGINDEAVLELAAARNASCSPPTRTSASSSSASGAPTTASSCCV